MDSATARQISHCRTSRLVVLRSDWSGPKTVVSRSVRIDTPVAMTNLESENGACSAQLMTPSVPAP